MINWSLAGEFMAFIVIAVLMLYFYEKRSVFTNREKLYWTCLWLSMYSLGVNVICVMLFRYSIDVPVWVNLLLNSIYFLMVITTCSLLAAYVFLMMLEHVYSKHCLKCAFTGLIVLNIIYVSVLLWNIKSGILFYFDGQGRYQRGELYTLGYAVVGVEIFMVYLCFIKNRPSVSKSIVRIIRITPPIVILLCSFQLFYPEIIVNGVALAVANLMLFLGFQNRAMKTDYLTMAGNRESFFENLKLRLAGHQNFQLLILSLRQYDIVNLNYGHQKGDEFLYIIVTELGRLFPNGEIFRFGNVDFAMILSWKSEEQAIKNAKKLQERCSQTWSVDELHTHVRTAILHMNCIGQTDNLTKMAAYIEYGLRRAKERPGKILLFSRKVLQEYEEEKRILDIMQRSIEEKRFRVWYQPIYHVDKSKYTAEALLRLKDYDGCPIPPSKFIPIAEEAGMIDELSWIVLEKVCLFLSQERNKEIECISVNLSMQQFADERICEKIMECIVKHNLSPDRLKLEVTERVLLQDMDYMKYVMNKMINAGFGFYLDDFGTGYSNLVSVLEFPFECVKLDKSLLKGFPGNQDSELMIKTLIDLFHSIGTKVVVEGVEEEGQKELLIAMKADFIQGYYYSYPLSEEKFASGIFKGTNR